MGKRKDEKPRGEVIHDLFREVFMLRETLLGIMDRVHEETGLSTPKRKVMGALSRIEPATVPDTAAELCVSRQFVQTVFNDLKELDLLYFTENPRHKRSRLASLTKEGRRALASAEKKEAELIQSALPEVDPEQAAGAKELLARIREALEESDITSP